MTKKRKTYKDKLLEEFSKSEVVMKKKKRDNKMIPLTIRISPALLQKLGKEANRRGINGHTTTARQILEDALNDSREHVVKNFLDKDMKKFIRDTARVTARETAKEITGKHIAM